MTNEITAAILAQMGAQRFAQMVGVSQVVAGPNYVQWRFKARAKNRANIVRVLLAADDTYTVEFFRLRGMTCGVVSSHEGVYADCLQPLFTLVTGLDTRI